MTSELFNNPRLSVYAFSSAGYNLIVRFFKRSGETDMPGGRKRLTLAMFLAVVHFGLSGPIGAQNSGADGQSLLFLGDESAYLRRIETLRNENGLYLDRRSDPSIVSTAATGLGVLAMAEATSRGLCDVDASKIKARQAFEKTVSSNLRRNRGWLSHFTDANGAPKNSSEVSTIDTAIFYSGLLQASRLLKDSALESDILESLGRIDIQFVIRSGVFLHGFYWNMASEPTSDATVASDPSDELEKPEFIPHMWNDSSEGVILYHLFGLPFPMQITRKDYPLFVYAYPLCFFDNPTYDRFLQDAIEGQIARLGYWGVTATDGPKGYVTTDNDVISPVLIGGIATKYPQYLEPLKSIKIEAASGSMHLPSGWVSSDDLTIDLSSAYILYSRWSRQSIDSQELLRKLREQEPVESTEKSKTEAIAT